MKRFSALWRPVLAAVLFLPVTHLSADETDRLTQVVSVTKTEQAEFPANGTLRIEKSSGELTIEGWDQLNVEIITIKSTKTARTPEAHDKAIQTLNRVQITPKREGNELVVTVEMPKHRAFPYLWPLSVIENFDLDTRIKVPRRARLLIKHTDGEVHIDDIAGNIDVTAHQGLIALHLPGDGPRMIDARSDWGSMNSDFPAKESRHPFPLGHKLVESPSAPAQSLHLRLGYGDIVILKARSPQAPPSMVAQK